MTSERKPLVLALDRFAGWLQAHLRFIIGLFLWAITMYIVFFLGAMQLGDRIQAASVITLVFVTWFYAVQTQALVKEERRALEEEKKKRAADFGEKKLITLLWPLREKLKKFNFSILPSLEESEPSRFYEYLANAKEQLQSIEEFFRINMHMASSDLTNRMLNFLLISEMPLLESTKWTEDKKKDYRKESENGVRSLILKVQKEIEQITAHIQSTYGISNQPPGS